VTTCDYYKNKLLLKNSKAKKISKKQFSLKKLPSITNGMDAIDNFYTDHAVERDSLQAYF